MCEAHNEPLLSMYRESCTMFRYYQTWRRLLLAGFFVIVTGLAKALQWVAVSHPPFLLSGLLGGAVLCVLIWCLDRRTCQLYQHAVDTGESLEALMDQTAAGYFGRKPPKPRLVNTANVLACLYLGGAAIMLWVAVKV